MKEATMRPFGDGLNLHSIRSLYLASMHRPRFLTNKFTQVFVLVFVSLSVLLCFRSLTAQTYFDTGILGSFDHSSSSLRDGNATLVALAPSYIKAIMNPDDTSFSQAECPRLDAKRYDYLRGQSNTKYFFALDLHQSASVIPRLLSSIVESMKFLGPKRCTLSIVEGRSTDGTFEILALLRTEIERMGATYHFVSTDLDSRAGNRIENLAKLRNQALEPIMGSSDLEKTTVVFLNDVAVCSEDILELVHQRVHLKADMTCAMDWTYLGSDPTFYDVWIARTLTGDTFFRIPGDGSWDFAWNLFWNNATTQDRLKNRQPFQVFACWNGGVAFTGEVLKTIKFRHPGKDECYQGEPRLFCKDMWYNGFGKIAVVPSVNIVYNDDDMRKIKALKGFTSDWTDKEEESQEFEWDEKPPEKVKCMSSFQNEDWDPWNQSLPLRLETL